MSGTNALGRPINSGRGKNSARPVAVKKSARGASKNWLGKKFKILKMFFISVILFVGFNFPWIQIQFSKSEIKNVHKTLIDFNKEFKKIKIELIGPKLIRLNKTK